MQYTQQVCDALAEMIQGQIMNIFVSIAGVYFATLRIYIFVTNNNLVIGDRCEVRIALIGHFQISHVLASQTCWVDSVH